MNRSSAFLIGLSLGHKTTNANGQASIDCGGLWKKFMDENIAAGIPGKVNNELWAVYSDYEGDHTKPYSFFIGCEVAEGTMAPEGLETLHIPGGNFELVEAKGKMPDCVIDAWKKIWAGDMRRAYQADYEIYGKCSQDWTNAQVDIYISVP